MKLSDIIAADAIIPSLAATTRDGAIRELAQALADAGSIPEGGFQRAVEAVMVREAQATTGIGDGVAFPHARVAGITKPVGAIGRSEEGIDFDSLDTRPVHVVVLLLSNPEDANEHLEAMEAVFKHIRREAFRRQLRSDQTRQEIAGLLLTPVR